MRDDLDFERDDVWTLGIVLLFAALLCGGFFVDSCITTETNTRNPIPETTCPKCGTETPR